MAKQMSGGQWQVLANAFEQCKVLRA